ncbi:unnamed protein product [Sphagnum tenellum]
MARSALMVTDCSLVMRLFLGLVWTQTVAMVVSDIDDLVCLQKFKESVGDPLGLLAGWNENTSASICDWHGVTCYGNNAPPVYFIQLAGSQLTGSFPDGLSSCKALTRLDLSDNRFTGPIPQSLCSDVVPNLVDLDVSRNNITGNIPPNLARCFFLNNIMLNNNQLSGTIPAQIGILDRLQKFNVSSNLLEGSIPSTFVDRENEKLPGFDASSFEDNPSLCGPPLRKICDNRPAKRVTSAGIIVGSSIGSASAVLAIGALMFWLLIHRTNKAEAAMLRDESKWAKRIRGPKLIGVAMFEQPLMRIRLADLMEATNDFSKDACIGSSPSGTMYRAEFRDGLVLAIKRLHGSSAHSERQFRTEMDTLGQLKHQNLVPLLGYCVAGSERLLVYKHMPNESLKYQLHKTFEKVTLDWPTRLKIAIGAARGLAWLHHTCNPRIIHRNISASSIQLDEEFEPKITEFGLARLMNTVPDTHISTFVNGNFGDVGYVAPEYVRTLMATTRGDVYSFGVVLLELTTGQKPVDVLMDTGFKGLLVDWVGMLSASGRITDAMERTLVGKGADDEMKQVLKVGLLCVNSAARERPSMYEVYQLLCAIGQKYNFSDQHDDSLNMSDSGPRSGYELVVSVS